MKYKIQKYLCVFLTIFTLAFMGLIFGPTEIFFGNYKELGFVYGEFIGAFICVGVGASVVVSLLVWLLPEKVCKGLLAIITGVCVAAYVQVMFLNRNAEQIGATAEGYRPGKNVILVDSIIWFIIIGLAILLVYYKKANYKKVIVGICGFLLAVQLVAFGSLFIGAEEDAFEYPEEMVGFSGKEQYTVSANENIIVFVLDNFANVWFERAAENNSELTNVVKDFTYYSNADSNYYKTYPSMLHILTGYAFDPTKGTNDFIKESWNNELTNGYFDLLSEHNYKVNVYTENPAILLGGNDIAITEGKVDNVASQEAIMEIDYERLYKVMLKMSCYRYSPDVLKPRFNVLNSEYASIVSMVGGIDYLNPDYYAELKENGLKADDAHNYFIFQHLNGTHEFINDSNCIYVESGTDLNQTVEGIFLLLGKYFSELKELGVYDNSTIIILADHGTLELPQPIFFIKEKNVRQDEMVEKNAPIDFDAMVPTILKSLSEDYSAYGESIYDYEENQIRERTYSIPRYDEGYPVVKRYDGMVEGENNVCYQYKYSGDLEQLMEAIMAYKIYRIVPMKDSLY